MTAFVDKKGKMEKNGGDPGGVLGELVAAARLRVERAKAIVSTAEMERRAFEAVGRIDKTGKTDKVDGVGAFERALRARRAANETAIIGECKRASPSAGTISAAFPYLEIARVYEAGGVDAISVLTEPTRFLGADEYLREIAATVAVPTLRKDFIVDEYMIFEAKTLGAAAILLIAAILTPEELASSLRRCDELGLSALVETRDEREIETALTAGARIVGVNNRNLVDFRVDFERCARLRAAVPAETLFVAESGVKSAADFRRLREIGADAALIGETLMRAGDKKTLLREFRDAANAR